MTTGDGLNPLELMRVELKDIEERVGLEDYGMNTIRKALLVSAVLGILRSELIEKGFTVPMAEKICFAMMDRMLPFPEFPDNDDDEEDFDDDPDDEYPDP